MQTFKMSLKAVAVFVALVTCALFFLRSSQGVQSAPVERTAKSVATSAESLFIMRVYLERNYPFVLEGTSDKLPGIFKREGSVDAYFSGTTSALDPLTIGNNYVRAYDLRELSVALSLYGSRAAKRKAGGIVLRTGYEESSMSFQTALDVLLLPMSLTPPKTFVDYDQRRLGIYGYISVIWPLPNGINTLADSLDSIDSSSNTPLLAAKNRLKRVKQLMRDFSRKQVTLIRANKNFGTSVENADSRAYAKLFEEHISILRSELTLLKTDIDKGFTELQKQQDAKAKVAPTAKTKNTP